MPGARTTRTVDAMRIPTPLRLAAIAVALTFTTSPAPAHADTLCEDGWMSPSDGGPGTCSWHGGIAGNDNDSGYGGGWRLPVGGGSNDDDGWGIDGALIAGGIAAGLYWLFRKPDEDNGKK